MKRFAKMILGGAALLSAALVLGAPAFGKALGEKLAPQILRAGQGKISSAENFIVGRMTEAGWLLGFAVLVLILWFAVCRAFKGRRHAWVPLSVCAFILCNVWVFAAMHTGIFWAGLFTGSATSNLTQFNFKRTLLKEHRTERQALLLGSSQTQAQLDENILNEQLKDAVWTTELHFPGSHALDMLLVLRRLRGQPGADLVCYLSEYYFYSGLYSTAAPFFLSVADIPTLLDLGWKPELLSPAFAQGFVAEALPLFACREPLSHRLLGVAINALEQSQHNSALETNLTRRAEITAQEIFKLDRHAEMQKKTFEEFVNEAARQNRRLVLLEGQVNPLLASRIPPEIRADMRLFLSTLAAQYSHVTLVPENVLPRQNAEMYEDLTHVTKETQLQFSLWFASYLKAQNKTAASN